MAGVEGRSMAVDLLEKEKEEDGRRRMKGENREVGPRVKGTDFAIFSAIS